MSSKKANPQLVDDTHLFRESVKDVNQIRHGKILVNRKRPKPEPYQTEMDQREVVRSLLKDTRYPDLQDGEELWFMRPGLQRATMRRLRSGQFAIESELDLHGQTVLDAQESLAQFLKQAQLRGSRCVRIIHGKGLGSPGRRPILRAKVNRWLQRRDEVLAFCSAQPEHGGTGAAYVLLKKSTSR